MSPLAIAPNHVNDAEAQQLINDWLKAKEVENQARARRVYIENFLLNHFQQNQEGSKTHKFKNYKIKTTLRYNYKADLQLLADVLNNLDIETAKQPIKVELALDTKKLKQIQENDSDLYTVISQYVTVTPSKVGFAIEQSPTGDEPNAN